jgi:hypothetical protein
MYIQPKSFEEPETLYCRAFARRMSVFKCMSKYVDANALRQKQTPCFQCAQGGEIRCTYAKS